MNTGLLVLRLVLGLLLVGHGSQKLFGYFGGPGLDGAGGFLHSLGFRPGRPMAIVAGTSEAGAGLLLAIGLFTPLASAAIIGTLLVAGSAHWAKGLWGQNGGYETPLLHATGAAALAFTGPGAYSLDKAFGLSALAGNIWGVGAVAVGVASGLAVVARGRRALAADAVGKAPTMEHISA
ncbi:MAG: DoxX family protein [Dermatophilaceae bacterium]